MVVFSKGNECCRGCVTNGCVPNGRRSAGLDHAGPRIQTASNLQAMNDEVARVYAKTREDAYARG
jgi:hypothetical protein